MFLDQPTHGARGHAKSASQCVAPDPGLVKNVLEVVKGQRLALIILH
jgi:hypothetical protein